MSSFKNVGLPKIERYGVGMVLALSTLFGAAKWRENSRRRRVNARQRVEKYESSHVSPVTRNTQNSKGEPVKDSSNSDTDVLHLI